MANNYIYCLSNNRMYSTFKIGYTDLTEDVLLTSVNTGNTQIIYKFEIIVKQKGNDAKHIMKILYILLNDHIINKNDTTSAFIGVSHFFPWNTLTIQEIKLFFDIAECLYTKNNAKLHDIVHKYIFENTILLKHNTVIRQLSDIIKEQLLTYTNITDEHLIKISKHMTITKFKMNNNITDNGIKDLIHLQYLNLQDNNKITNNSIKKLIKLITIFINDNITMEGMSKLSNLQQINVKDDGIYINLKREDGYAVMNNDVASVDLINLQLNNSLIVN